MSAADGDFLARWVRACAALLGHGGRFATIVRTDALPTLLAACDGRIGALGSWRSMRMAMRRRRGCWFSAARDRGRR